MKNIKDRDTIQGTLIWWWQYQLQIYFAAFLFHMQFVSFKARADHQATEVQVVMSNFGKGSGKTTTVQLF